MLCVKWLDLLPHQTKRRLLLIKGQLLEELAAIADEAHNMGPTGMATSYQPRAPTPPPNFLSQELAALDTAIAQLPSLMRGMVQSSQRAGQGRSKS